MLISMTKRRAATLFAASSTPDRSQLPGFDPFMHQSKVVDEFVEVRDGRQVVVYRTKPEIYKEARERLQASLFNPS